MLAKLKWPLRDRIFIMWFVNFFAVAKHAEHANYASKANQDCARLINVTRNMSHFKLYTYLLFVPTFSSRLEKTLRWMVFFLLQRSSIFGVTIRLMLASSYNDILMVQKYFSFLFPWIIWNGFFGFSILDFHFLMTCS